jgi:very-short-patch-repair endonuclease
MVKIPALVGIVPRKNLWSIIQKEKWYHIPVESAPKNAHLVKYIGFYFPSVFGEGLQYKVHFYAGVSGVDVVKRVSLFPDEPEHKRAEKNYFQFHLREIKNLPQPIPSLRWRRIIHIPTSYKKLLTAREINDLYDTSPIEEKMYREMKRGKIPAERQLFVKVDDRYYSLDFGVFCKRGMIDLECDGERYHILPGAITRDRRRNNELTSSGWNVLRFSGKEIRESPESCIRILNKTIRGLGGIADVSSKTGIYKSPL